MLKDCQKKYTIMESSQKIMLLKKKFGLKANTLRQKQITKLKISFFDNFVYDD